MLRHKAILFFSTLLLVAVTHADDRIYRSFLSSRAMDGYDPVAYFTLGQAKKGKSHLTLTYQGADWYFLNTEHLEMFRKDPQRYAPQYGGYCAWAIAHGSTASGDPLRWTIHQNKLFLNYDKKTQSDWEKDKNRWIQAADRNWPEIIL